MSQNSYLREFYSQVPKNVFVADLTVLSLIRTVSSKMSQNLISPRVLCTSIKIGVPSCFDRFTAYYYCMYKNVTKTHISASSVYKYKKSCS